MISRVVEFVEYTFVRAVILGIVVEVDHVNDGFRIFALFFGCDTSALQRSLPLGRETLYCGGCQWSKLDRGGAV